MSKIYLRLSTQIAKVLRHELAGKNGAIDIPPHIRSDKYWQKRCPYLKGQDIKRKPSLREMFERSLRTEQEEGEFIPYNLAYCEDEYNQFPDSEEKQGELVAFTMPKTINRGFATYVTNGKTIMEKFGGSAFRQALIYHFYELLSLSLHANQLECVREQRPFNISEAIHLFAADYNLSSNEEETLRIQYYRRKKS